MFIIFCIVFVLIAQHASAATYECACQCPYGSNSSLAFTSENSAEACVSACIASPFNPCASVNTYACLGTDCAYSSSYDNSTTFTVRSLFRCSCQCPYGSVQGSVYTSGNSSEACIRACIASPFNPCVASNTYACSGTDCTYSSSYDNSTEATTTTRNIATSLFRCSCQCPYGSIQTPVYTSDNSPEACVRACIASPFNPCISSNTYACLGTDCMYSSSYDSPIVTNTIVQRFQCSCQCPYGSTPSFAYTSENSSQACIRACIASPSNPCIPWNTYACLGTDCAYANWYIHSRRILAVHRPCACQCPSGSSRTSAFAIGDSSQNCAIACNSTLEINAMEDNTTIDSIIDEFDSVYNINYIDTKRNETSITAGGVTFGADEGSEAVDPRDVAVLASYRRAIDRHMYTDEARFEQVQIRARHHLLRTLGCKVADIEKILQWSWIPRDNCGFRLAGHPLKVPRPPNGKVYSMVHGISFYENGSFFLNLTEADEGTALFNSDDVELIMKRGITGASFSLDPPLGSDLPHPFQKATWAPYDALNGTDFLATMLHADLWLKSMGFLVEASARSPFRIRSIRDGVYNSLPQDLYQRLFKQGRLERDKLFSSTRMWIESGTMKYNVLEQDDNVMYVFGSPNMQIKYENLIQRVKNHTTGLTDTVTGSNSSWHEHFAATATENYIELGHSFPELLRLAELSKLTAIALVFQHRYRELRKIVLPPTTESVAQVLTTSNLRGQVFNGRWPLATYARVEELLDKALVEQGINLAHKYWVRNLDQSRALIRQQLTELENKQITEITQALEKAFNISSNRISRTAISSYLSGTGSAAEYALLQEIVSGIAERIRSSQSGAIRLYETMSQSGYSVGDLSSVLPEFAQISLGKGPIKNFEDMESSSCYYVPTQISLVYQGNGSFLQQRGGVKLQPRFQYQKDPIFGFPQYRPLRPMVFTDIVTPSPITRNRDILFDRVSFKDSKTKETWYGPKYSGTTRLSDYNGWDRLIQQQKASIDDKKIISGMSINEGKIEAVQSYDSQVVSAGAMQKTINEKGTGEFPIQVWNFKNKHPQLYEELFKAQGWEVKKQSGAYSMTYNQETGNDLKTSIREDFQEKIKKTSSKPLQVLVNAISTPEFQELQVTEFVDRLNKQVLPMKPKGYDSYTISDYLQSHLGRAVALDQHVNAPSNVKVDFGKALNHLFKEHPKLSKNPADWGENRQKYETELIEYYGEHRRMHDPIGRFKKLKDAFE